ncbi:uncharacterized protein LOC101896248 [Musca domestica]|uniref:Uncharacterized protein LOC101896248 n=1 Tax=Musca domestica TaxID=7370 RepID=A0A9J7D134_MUSDO|nr:uncharacterized protein LOC101896248 [Musca domestica]
MNWRRSGITFALIFIIGVTSAAEEGEEILITTTRLSTTSESEILLTTTEKSGKAEEAEETTTEVEEETTTTTTVTIDDNENTEPHVKEPETPLPEYAIKQMNSILNHILQASYRFVTQMLQETTADPESYPREKLKTYAELLLRLLHIDDELEYDEEYHYNLMLKKLNFLKGRTTKYLSTYLPEGWVEVYMKNKQDIVVWIDESAEELHDTFRCYISDEDDHVKYQYFNEGFDDLLRANLLQQKLTILLDLIKVAANRKKVSFTDIYMQT